MSTEHASADNPMGSLGGMLAAPGADVVTQLGAATAALGAEKARADHFQRLVAAIVAKLGPIPVRPSEYHGARPDDIQTVETISLFEADDPDGPMTFLLPEQAGDFEGMVTREPQVAAALTAAADKDIDDQTRAVLRVLGLPVRPEV